MRGQWNAYWHAPEAFAQRGLGIGIHVQVFAKHGGVRDAWADTVTAQAISGVIESDRFAEQQNGAFGSSVGGRRALANEARDRSNIYNVAARILLQVGDAMFDRQKNRFHVNVHQAIPILRVEFMEQFDLNNAGAIGDDLKTTELLDG